ncbi:SUMF1/EgtB/PvdO family nonheme iron enzyme [Candidatus Uabimicrobium amorphum]|uniref:Serine/threonine-protein kinase pkn1 n=1 Tax=Uabimicrobium amorphum TaxID=2596890 RepID=A0A5S9F4H9_UABAM|nr:SUMF1/EgtB/PvdO family nonheme iron enzyme [Candidatus Uabimicrobium amorphum]BBM85321.1 serine/threonine-protein kinase pkn1 [Candidatus Uabimicrobium amorphum]
MNTSLLHQEIHGYFVDRLEKQDDQGTTYYGFDVDDSYPVAIKTINFISDDHFHHLAKLKDLSHNNLTNVHEVEIWEDDSLIIIRDWVDSKSLHQVLQEKSYSLLESINILKNNLLGISYLHKQDYFHGNLTLHNIFEWESNSILLTDFGLRCTEDYAFQDDINFLHKLFYKLIVGDPDVEEFDDILLEKKLSEHIPMEKVESRITVMKYYENLKDMVFKDMRSALIDLQPVIGCVYDLQENDDSDNGQKIETGKLRRTRTLKKVGRTSTLKKMQRTGVMPQIESTRKRKRKDYGIQRNKEESSGILENSASDLELSKKKTVSLNNDSAEWEEYTKEVNEEDDFPDFRLSTEVSSPLDPEVVSKAIGDLNEPAEESPQETSEQQKFVDEDFSEFQLSSQATQQLPQQKKFDDEDFSEFRLSTEKNSVAELSAVEEEEPQSSPEEAKEEKPSNTDVVFEDAQSKDISFKHIDLNKNDVPVQNPTTKKSIKSYIPNVEKQPSQTAQQENEKPRTVKLDEKAKYEVLRQHTSNLLKDVDGTGTYVMPKPVKKEYQRKRAKYVWFSGIAIFIMAFTYIKLQTDFDIHTAMKAVFGNGGNDPSQTVDPKTKGWFDEIMPKGIIKGKKKGEYLWTADQSIMVYIPAGKFWRGSNAGKKQEQPERLIFLSAYYIDKYELSNAQFRQFVAQTKRKSTKYLSHKKLGEDERPVVSLSWHDAHAYAQWAKKRLPTEAEWEKAAKGGIKISRYQEGHFMTIDNTIAKRVYPWGNRYKKNNANMRKKKGGPSFVSSFLTGRSPYGCHNMLGNVWEWCADYYQTGYYNSSPIKDPQGPEKKMKYRVCRGGAWSSNKVYTFTRRGLQPEQTKVYVGARFVVTGTKNE